MAYRDYGQDQELAKQFLKEYTYVDDDGEMLPKYGPMLTKLANREEILMTIDLADLDHFNHELAENVTGNSLRYIQIFQAAIDEILPTYKTQEVDKKTVMDVFIEQRLFVAERNKQKLGQSQQHANETSQGQSMPGAKTVDFDNMYPPDLIRRYEIAFKPVTLRPIAIRDVNAACIGKLVTVRGIVTRVTDVKPKVTVVCYTCDQCMCETFHPVKGSEFTPLFECTSAQCKSTKTLGRLTMQIRGSKLVKYQEIKLQEHSDQVPIGHIPRTITVLAHGEQTRRCAAGDHISISGVYLTVERSSFRMRTAGLSADTYIESSYITQMNKTEDDELNIDPLSNEEAIQLIHGRQNFLKLLSKSIAPEIWGHEDLKIALLLLLVGGVDRAPDGMKVRGNINICLMGDPGVAKSQLLSFIDRLASRSQYTTGRGSSGVGLTAAVLKDPITGELCLEGGALVLADQGICCIDEFDKMMDADRTAIHEVMEQQTVSIAKAGIMTTLNARVSILAAANPAYGRYIMGKTIQENLQLPPALLSRFDLLWLIRDLPGRNDLDLAQHVTNIHSNPEEVPEVDSDIIDMKTMRRYISLCKTKDPVIPDELSEKLIDIYLSIRSRGRVEDSTDSLFTSPRSLLAIIRLSTAFARLRLSNEVEAKDIDEAVRLYNVARESIETEKRAPTNISVVNDIIRGVYKKMMDKEIPIKDVYAIAEEKNVNKESVDEALFHLDRIETIYYKSGDENIIMIEN